MGPCGLDVQTSGGGHVAARGLAGSVDTELRAEIGPAGSYVILENGCLRAEYESYFENTSQFGMRHLLMKGAGNEDQICLGGVCGTAAYIGGGAGRGILESASIVWDGPDRKTVRFTWWDNVGNPQNRVIEEVSVYPNSCFLKTNHIDVKYSNNIVDLGSPGGTWAGTHVAHGAADWIRGYVTHNYAPSVGAYYNRYPGDGVYDPVDGGSLNYNGHFVFGVYNPANGRGFGRAIPVADISILKFLLSDTNRRGLELFPYPFFVSHQPFTGYLYTVTGGETEMLSLGRQLVDNGAGSTQLACGDVIEVEARPHRGWTFDHWSGSLSGNANPAAITLSGLDTVTAVFAMDYAAFADDFETYAAGADPDDWFDTAAGNSLVEEDNFKVVDRGGSMALGTSATGVNIHSHYTAPGAASWSSQEFSGRMRLTDTRGGVGVTFLSQFPSSSRYYRLRRGGFAGGNAFHMAPVGTTITCDNVSTGVSPTANSWYRFRIETQDTGTRTEIRAKVWPDAGEEPADWQVNCHDDSASRLVSGTVGVWSMANGEKQWDELAVRHVQNVLKEDFSTYAIGDNPADWLDTAAGSMVEEDNFAVLDVDGQLALGTLSVATNIHSHYLGPNSSRWSSFEFHGRMRMTETNGGVGVTFLSDYPNSSAYYRLRRGDFNGGRDFHIAIFGATSVGGATNTGAVPLIDTWYRFRVEVTDTGSRTEIRAKVWEDGSQQPPTWQADCYVEGPERLTAGTIGLWSMGPGAKYWDDFAVSMLESASLQQSIDVTLELHGVSNVVTRDVVFVITDCQGTTDTRVLPVTTDATGVGTVSLTGTSLSAAWISVQEGHTLKRTAPVSYDVSGVATVDLTGPNRLLAGDFQTAGMAQDNLVDITDFSILAANWNEPVDPNLGTGADATGDGVQSTGDFAAIQLNFLVLGEPDDLCGSGLSAPSPPISVGALPVARASIHVTELGLGKARGADQNGDGIVDSRDIRAFAQENRLELTPSFRQRLQRLETKAPGHVGPRR